MDVTFLTNEDKDSIDESINKLTKDLAALGLSLKQEQWEFELEDGTVTTKTVFVMG